ncbi:diguanylate cyclase domain-containing protein [Brotaphodocola sp.]|uniref:sensor domain-containing diguanylate cyclase n=1 Tax=Brotaphodocola sp. TaxID=3073577 RepID=UPI003D7EA012
MEDKNCEKLFEYLRDILYSPDTHPLDVETLDPPYQKLGKGLRFLDKAVREMKSYSAELSRGNLSVNQPEKDNFLCQNLKNMHANLNHMAWQAKQVARGDYSQSVSYLGEFSDAFNKMTAQLREREMRLREEAQKEKAHANMMEGYSQLLMELICRSEEQILVVSVEDGQVFYCNTKDANEDPKTNEIFGICLEMTRQEGELEHLQEMAEQIWETEDSAHRIYKITTGLMHWQGELAYVHIIREATAERAREKKLEVEAYRDPLTGIRNRTYFEEQMRKLLERKEKMVFCYCDLDHLKYVNDRYGHLEGDRYIRRFVDTVKSCVRENDLFARVGGDEFCVILRKCPQEMAVRKMRRIQREFEETGEIPYPQSFSCGLVEISGKNRQQTLEEIIQCVDKAMYEQKRDHKEEYEKQLNLSASEWIVTHTH